MFDDFLSPRIAGEARGWSPAVDMIDKKDEIVLRADLPGLEHKDIQVNVDSGMLTIHGNRQEAREAKEEDYYCCERWTGSFSRTMMLPPGVEADKIKATFKNGVLEVHVPKSSKARPHPDVTGTVDATVALATARPSCGGRGVAGPGGRQSQHHRVSASDPASHRRRVSGKVDATSTVH